MAVTAANRSGDNENRLKMRRRLGQDNYTEDHVIAHIFLCMLAYYVEFHLRKA